MRLKNQSNLPHPQSLVETLETQSLVETLKRGGGRNRTDVWGFCRARPYHLATPPPRASDYQYTLTGGVTTETRPAP